MMGDLSGGARRWIGDCGGRRNFLGIPRQVATVGQHDQLGKGRIIFEWRQALEATGVDWQQYSDEAWSRRVGNVSGQHVGRLRRVFERFGVSRDLPGALLEPLSSGRSIGMTPRCGSKEPCKAPGRSPRCGTSAWQAFGGAGAEQSSDADQAEAELDEDFSPESQTEIRDPADSSGRAFDADRSVDEDESQAESADGVPFDPDAPWDQAGTSAAVRRSKSCPSCRPT